MNSREAVAYLKACSKVPLQPMKARRLFVRYFAPSIRSLLSTGSSREGQRGARRSIATSSIAV